ncbi:MAG: DHH family phosphoesterase [Lachnospiraceae bacterium]|nr:DHH family phosphoesterase [Lachnospiraceae bacterium]
MSKSKIRLTGQIRAYVQWPIRISILVIILVIIMFFIDMKAGMVSLVFAVIYIAFALYLYFKNSSIVLNDFISFATQYGQIQKQLLRELEIPYALLDENGRLIWTNESFENTLHIKSRTQRSIMAILPDLDKNMLPGVETENELMLTHEDREYRVCMKKVSVVDMVKDSVMVEDVDYDSYLIAFFMFDETKVNALQRQIDEQQLVCGLIYIDNYDEALESVEEVRRSLLGALLDRRINKYLSAHEALIKKMEKDKYLVLIKKSHLEKLKEDRFNLLEDVKTVNIGNEMALTLSIGFGMGGDSYIQNYDYARNAIDLALGRGGDQAVIKTPAEVTYFGGKTRSAEKNTRVKARVKAHALREILEGTDQILVMGHKITDIDALGAAIGIFRAAKTFGKSAHIVINDISSSIRPMVDALTGQEDNENELIVNNMRAIEMADRNTVVVVVDVNRPSYTECSDLLARCRTIVVIDHHRQGSEIIENATLSYIEPYASSASEMVAEILQYISDSVKLKPVEADCIYAGITMDTNNFMAKTGVRTFEAAAYLRRNGADVIRVRKMSRDTLNDYIARSETVSHVSVYKDIYAISYYDGDSESPTVIAAQAANELLNISGIRASFVLTDYNGKIYISARSIDDINVQLIMEKLGGGGHMTIAGAQLEGADFNEASERLKNTIDEMEREGAI